MAASNTSAPSPQITTTSDPTDTAVTDIANDHSLRRHRNTDLQLNSSPTNPGKGASKKGMTGSHQAPKPQSPKAPQPQSPNAETQKKKTETSQK